MTHGLTRSATASPGRDESAGGLGGHFGAPHDMGERARTLAIPDAAERLVAVLLEVAA